MKLLLTSSGITNDSIRDTLLELAGESPKNLNLVFIPTAANPEKGNKEWLIEDINNFKKLDFASFDVIDISAVKKDVWLPIFKKADILVFGGGDVYYLLQWIKKSGLNDLFAEFLKTKIYVGISAGSMVIARELFLSTAGILYYEKTGSLKKVKGLGFVDFELRPHLNSKWFPKVRLPYLEELAKKTKSTFYAIDDSTAIKVVDDEISIITEGKWKKFN